MKQDTLLPSESRIILHRRYIGLVRKIQILLKGMTLGVKLFFLLALIATVLSSLVMAEQVAKQLWNENGPKNDTVQSIEVYIVESFNGSQLLNYLKEISIVTAAITFLWSGKAAQKSQTRYVALSALDNSQDVKMSLARNLALKALVQNHERLRGLVLPKDADLKKISLQGACLPEATLNGVILQEANLSKAQLDRTALQEANLKGANLEAAYLVKATLTRANLQSAKLMFAKLRHAILLKADFRCANLEGTDFEGADVEGADFRWVKNLTVKQIQQAQNWQNARYDDNFFIVDQDINAVVPISDEGNGLEDIKKSERDEQLVSFPIVYM